jgi:glycerate-2-kinase
MALAAAERLATEFGYTVHRLGSAVQGDTAEAVSFLAGALEELRGKRKRGGPPLCVLAGGETTVTLRSDHGLGGRNQQLVLALLLAFKERGLSRTVVLCGGTDGEDGPTNAAGAIGDDTTFTGAAHLGIDPNDYLNRQDAYHFFEPLGDLLTTGLTGTNVMDVCVLIVE